MIKSQNKPKRKYGLPGKRVCHVLFSSFFAMFCLLVIFASCGNSDVEAVYTGDPNSTLFYDYEQLVHRLNHIENVSDGKVDLEVIGQSNLGRDIYLATVGTGDTPVLIFTQQHGNEPHGTQAALDLLEDLGTSDDPVIQNILKELTVHIVPRLNPDGSEPDVFTRHNVDPLAPPPNSEEGRFGRYGVGWDLNRYHTMNWEDHPLSDYSEFAIMTEEFGLVHGRTFDGSVDHDGEQGLLIDCGDGMTPEDFPSEVEGNIALIERNGTFNDKAANAEDAGAIGFVLYQKDPEATILPRLNLSDPPDIPATVISRDKALKIINHDGPVTGQFITLTYDENPATETQLLLDTVQKISPLWIIDSHNQGTWFSSNDRVITSSITWGTYEDVSPEAQALTKKICVAMYDHMKQFEESEVTEYREHPTPIGGNIGTATNGYAREGIATVLLEHWNNYTHPQIAEILIKHAYEMMYVTLVKTADGTLFDLDPDRAYNMPLKTRPRPDQAAAEGLFELMGYLDQKAEDPEESPEEDELPPTGNIHNSKILLIIPLLIFIGYLFRRQRSRIFG